MTRRELKRSGSMRDAEEIGRARIEGEGGSTGLRAGLFWLSGEDREFDGESLLNQGWAIISGI